MGDIFKVLGASNHVPEERAVNDYYATDPRAVEMLLELEEFSPDIWEPACGEGHISKVLEANGHHVLSTDIVYRGYGLQTPLDFLEDDPLVFDGDIITNPPYKDAQAFVERAMDIITDGHKVAMFLKVQFLEGQKRKELFDKYPPKVVYVSRSRLACYRNGDMSCNPASTIAYAWYIWEKGFTGEPVIRWFN